jgi:aldehyde:ferredoxin oxidoreductase
MGWQGKMLRVDLTTGTAYPEPLSMEWAAQCLGSRGLATRCLYEETDPTTDPVGVPVTILLFATGPLPGTMASTGGRFACNDNVEILDARDFIWGETVWEAEERIRTRHHNPLVHMTLIGRTGEDSARFACIVDDRDRADPKPNRD